MVGPVEVLRRGDYFQLRDLPYKLRKQIAGAKSIDFV